MHLSLSEIFAVRVVRRFLACDMFDRLSIFAVERRRGLYCHRAICGGNSASSCVRLINRSRGGAAIGVVVSPEVTARIQKSMYSGGKSSEHYGFYVVC